MAKSQVSGQPAPYQRKDRLGYLKSAYAIYTGHINQMFNYFMLAVGLLGNAIVQMMNPTWQLSGGLPAAAALVGAVLSIIFLGIHRRSRQILDTVEAGLKVEEQALFGLGSSGFLSNLPKPGILGGLKILFPLAYLSVASGFIGIAGYLLLQCSR